MKMKCDDATPLVPSYLDGELSEEQAGPLRRHLLECSACREVAQGEQTLKRWFVSEAAIPVPAGFAQRVARRAFAGDPGLLVEEGAEVVRGDERRIAGFVLGLTALAAAILLCLSLAIREQRLPSTPEVSAESYPAVLEELEQLNRSESAAERAARTAEPGE